MKIRVCGDDFEGFGGRRLQYRQGDRDRSMKKSYLGLVIWLIAYTALMTAGGFLPLGADLLIRVFMVFSAVSLVILMAMMYFMDTVYWMNGVSFEQALEAGIERRKRYAFLNLRLFGIFAIAYTLYSIVAYVLHFPWVVDIVVFTVATIVVAIYSNRYKL